MKDPIYFSPLEFWLVQKVVHSAANFLKLNLVLFGTVFSKNIWWKMKVVLARKKHRNKCKKPMNYWPCFTIAMVKNLVMSKFYGKIQHSIICLWLYPRVYVYCRFTLIPCLSRKVKFIYQSNFRTLTSFLVSTLKSKSVDWVTLALWDINKKKNCQRF